LANIQEFLSQAGKIYGQTGHFAGAKSSWLSFSKLSAKVIVLSKKDIL